MDRWLEEAGGVAPRAFDHIRRLVLPKDAVAV